MDREAHIGKTDIAELLAELGEAEAEARVVYEPINAPYSVAMGHHDIQHEGHCLNCDERFRVSHRKYDLLDKIAEYAFTARKVGGKRRDPDEEYLAAQDMIAEQRAAGARE